MTQEPLLFLATLTPSLLRLLASLAVGLLVANIIESLELTRSMARVASPLVRLGHLRDVSGASFSMAFFSSVASNSLLAESYDKGELSARELKFANLFNSLPAYLTHLPTLFFMTWPVLGYPAAVYVGLTLLAAALRTGGTIIAGRLMLPPLPEGCVTCRLDERPPLQKGDALRRAWKRFTRRLPRLLLFTIPVYVLMALAQQYGVFRAVEAWLGTNVGGMSFLRPEALSIVVLHLAAEFGAAVSAAGSVLDTGTMTHRDIVLALLVGNVLSTPMRAFRHQFPAYAGYFRPALALQLVLANQVLRATSITFVGIVYYWLTT